MFDVELQSELDGGDSCSRKLLSQTASLTAGVWPMYLVLQLENTTVGGRLDDQLIAPLPKLKTKPEVDRRIS